MFFDRYGSHIKDFQDCIRTDRLEFVVPAFSKSSNMLDLQSFEICITNNFENELGIPLDFVKYPGVSKDK